jgi:APA family basic amino acid/polyamine antiporter
VQTLARRLGVPGAAAIGVASMLGAGIFFVWAPATAAAGTAVLVALPLAAVIAILNALSTTRLAVLHPVSGGAYAYGRAEVGDTVGFIAGILFLVGKTASVAAIGLIAGAYLWPGGERWVAAGLIVVLAAINATGVRTTAVVSAVAAGVVVVVLLAILIAAGSSGAAPAALDWSRATPGGVLQATGLIFFAFAGYARIATLAEEVRDPGRTLPRAVVVSVAAVLALSAATLGVLLWRLGTGGLAEATSPVAAIAPAGSEPVIRAAVAVACIGSMLSVLAGLSRTSMAMARDGELPRGLARVSRVAGSDSPVVAEVAVAVVAIVAVLLLDPSRVVGVSACAVLGYYGVAHLAALTAGSRLGLPRGVPIAGFAGCTLVVWAIGWTTILPLVAVVVLCLAVRALVTGRGRPVP